MLVVTLERRGDQWDAAWHHTVSVLRLQLCRTRPTAPIALWRGKLFFDLFLQNVKHKNCTCPFCLTCERKPCTTPSKKPSDVKFASFPWKQINAFLYWLMRLRTGEGENNKSGKFLVWLLMFSTSMWLTLDDLWIWNITTFWKTRRSVNLKHHAMCWHRECLPLATARRLCRVFGFLHRLKILKCFCSSTHWEYTRV